MDIKKFIRHYVKYLIVIAVLAVIYLIVRINYEPPVRTNTECVQTERVYDYADVLTDEEEDWLRQVIAWEEERAHCDIVLVTLNESLEAYGEQWGESRVNHWVQIAADQFYDNNAFGYNYAGGDGFLLMDNWYRERDGGVHSWLSTMGRAKAKMSTDEIESLLDEGLMNVDSDPAQAYADCITLAAKECYSFQFRFWMYLAAAILLTVGFIMYHMGMNHGKDTTTQNTYLDGAPRMLSRQDTFMYKKVTTRHIERNSGSGGSGGGGGGHGGGGHTR